MSGSVLVSPGPRGSHIRANRTAGVGGEVRVNRDVEPDLFQLPSITAW